MTPAVRTVCFTLAAMSWMILPLWAQPNDPLRDQSTDRLELKDGTQLQGMLLDESPRNLEFLEINRPPGKPMFAVIHTISANNKKRVDKVSGEDRQKLEKLVDRLRNHTQIRAAAKDSLTLKRTKSAILETDQVWEYRGDRFILISPLDEDTTRTFAVRVDQIFQAFEHWLPPKQKPNSPIQIVLFYSIDSYSAYLKKIGLQIDNPAVYVPHTNQVLIGSDLGSFLARLEVASAGHQAMLDQWAEREKRLPDDLNQLAKRLKEAGWSPDAVITEVQTRREAWQRDFKKAQGQIQVVDRRNQSMLDTMMNQATQHLCHESFHAYVENYLYPQGEYEVPIWLNEGLAQLFEHAQFENGTFRIDLPPQELLASLKDRLERDNGLSLQRILQTEAGSFILFENLHEGRLDYDVAWGLAWYLVFQKQLFAPGNLDRYVHKRSQPAPTVEETFGESVSRVQAEWVAFIRQLDS
ncbi:hypothetical protein Pan97_18270 [Bremerella volcania]|uniref:DUF1570 domain-containing protein n=1 Tax=Bremerella volcania TaxID=2527984 RepID=A0A518C6H5_9BACT|nr:DUF1570 domain-containing protein [Bremerella volcania]QDU74811.1 hypothetical protein Pan97_18270 [Bremerella volcania]